MLQCRLNPGLPTVSPPNLVAGVPQNPGEQIRDVALVIDNQHRERRPVLSWFANSGGYGQLRLVRLIEGKWQADGEFTALRPPGAVGFDGAAEQFNQLARQRKSYADLYD